MCFGWLCLLYLSNRIFSLNIVTPSRLKPVLRSETAATTDVVPDFLYPVLTEASFFTRCTEKNELHIKIMVSCAGMLGSSVRIFFYLNISITSPIQAKIAQSNHVGLFFRSVMRLDLKYLSLKWNLQTKQRLNETWKVSLIEAGKFLRKCSLRYYSVKVSNYMIIWLNLGNLNSMEQKDIFLM